VVRHEKSRRAPGLPRHAAWRETAAVQPLAEAPAAERVGARERGEVASGAAAPAVRGQRRDPEAADHRPDAAVVVLPGEVLAVPRHVRPPQQV
jgi:hypothetical protein